MTQNIKEKKDVKEIKNNIKKSAKQIKEKIKDNGLTYKVVLEKDENKHRSIVEMVYIFTICSMIGWLVELVYIYIAVRKIVNRGVLYAPMCCIYGFGALILYLLFYNIKPTKINIPYTFLAAAIMLRSF